MCAKSEMQPTRRDRVPLSPLFLPRVCFYTSVVNFGKKNPRHTLLGKENNPSPAQFFSLMEHEGVVRHAPGPCPQLHFFTEPLVAPDNEKKTVFAVVHMFVHLALQNEHVRDDVFACASNGCGGCAVLAHTVFSGDNRVLYFLAAGLATAEVVRRCVDSPRGDATVQGAGPALATMFAALHQVPIEILVICIPTCMDIPPDLVVQEEPVATGHAKSDSLAAALSHAQRRRLQIQAEVDAAMGARVVLVLMNALLLAQVQQARVHYRVQQGIKNALAFLEAAKTTKTLCWTGARDAQVPFLAAGFLTAAGFADAVKALAMHEDSFFGRADALLGTSVGTFLAWIPALAAKCDGCQRRMPCAAAVTECGMFRLLRRALDSPAVHGTTFVSRSLYMPMTFGCDATVHGCIVVSRSMVLECVMLERCLRDALWHVACAPCYTLPRIVLHFLAHTTLPPVWLVAPLLAKWKSSRPPWASTCLKLALSRVVDCSGGSIMTVVPVPSSLPCKPCKPKAARREAALDAVLREVRLPTARLVLGPKKGGKMLAVRVALTMTTLPWMTRLWLRLSAKDAVEGSCSASLEVLLQRFRYLCERAEDTALRVTGAPREALWNAFHGTESDLDVGHIWQWAASGDTGTQEGMCALFSLLPCRARRAVLDKVFNGESLLGAAPWLVLQMEQADPGAFCLWATPTAAFNMPGVPLWCGTFLPTLVRTMALGLVQVPLERLTASLAAAKLAGVTSTQDVVDALVEVKERKGAWPCMGLELQMPRLKKSLPRWQPVLWRNILRAVLQEVQPSESPISLEEEAPDVIAFDPCVIEDERLEHFAEEVYRTSEQQK